MGKMFAFLPLLPKDNIFFINLKCDPDKAIELREDYEYVVLGYHSNKNLWNSVYFENGITDEKLKELVIHSVEEIIKKLPKKTQEVYNK